MILDALQILRDVRSRRSQKVSGPVENLLRDVSEWRAGLGKKNDKEIKEMMKEIMDKFFTVTTQVKSSLDLIKNQFWFKNQVWLKMKNLDYI